MIRRGFSLIEVIVVMVTTGILAAIAMPRYADSVARYRVDFAAKRIVADLALAQSRAKVASTSRTVTFTVRKSIYQLIGIVDTKDPKTDYTVYLGDSPYQVTISGVDLGGDTSVIFNGFGLPDSGGKIAIGAGSAQRTITIDAVTGAATIQ